MFMKFYTLLFLTSFTVSIVYSQEIRLNAYGHYVFDDKVESFYSNTNYFNGTIKGGLLWGGGLEFAVPDYSFELLYLRQDTKAPVHYFDMPSVSEKNTDLDLDINWLMASANRLIPSSAEVEPYAGVMLGVAMMSGHNPEKQTSASATKFAWGLRLGSNFWIADRLGIKVQAQLLCAAQAAGGSLYFGTGGAGAAVTTYSTMAQFSLGGGLVFKLREH
jgi:hypothetical protein